MTCRPPASTTVAENRDVRVFATRRADGDARLYGCLRRRGKPVLLKRARGEDDVYDSFSVTYSHVRLAGRFVAWHRTEAFEHIPACKADCPPGVVASFGLDRSIRVLDLVRRLRRVAPVVGSPPAGNVLRLNRFGQALWGEWLDGNQVELVALDASGRRPLGAGAIHPEDIRLDGRTAHWVQDRRARSRRLR